MKKFFILECHSEELDTAFFIAEYLNDLGHDYTISVTSNEGQFDLKSVSIDYFKIFNNILYNNK
jgi:hypothetical protein